ncbi:MAG: ABC transporter permease [Lachnospiraceae bacterium]
MREIIENRKLIWKLARNDFNKRYAGSSLGAVWALIQPVVTVLMYWVVFEFLLGNKYQSIAGGVEVPYVLYLTAGLVPWFFFSEAWNYGTSSLLAYQYLVKKVVFNIRILPVIRVTAAMFIHVFFAFVLIVIAGCYGYYPSVYTLQLAYYSIALAVFTLGMSYITSAIVVFFRDLTQIISIALQLGMWATPILWDISMAEKWGAVFGYVVKLNPVCYIVNGYRSAIYGEQWFFETPVYTVYFWVVSLAILWLGRRLFDKLKYHFADVM